MPFLPCLKSTNLLRWRISLLFCTFLSYASQMAGWFPAASQMAVGRLVFVPAPGCGGETGAQ